MTTRGQGAMAPLCSLYYFLNRLILKTNIFIFSDMARIKVTERAGVSRTFKRTTVEEQPPIRKLPASRKGQKLNRWPEESMRGNILGQSLTLKREVKVYEKYQWGVPKATLARRI